MRFWSKCRKAAFEMKNVLLVGTKKPIFVEGLTGKVLRVPERSEISAPIDEHLIVELYSRL